ncbi:MAG: carboxypeptidase regulatory-like domain-containing protein, partial [Candidatus Aminicenantes bacterium]|nr:carboxypeptidase regulatory-like domain-containing protein [Candidatus Aminicenantes bacterium]
MRTMLATAAIVLAALFSAALAGRGPDENDLKTAVNLSGPLQSLENKELAVTFSDDMLPLGGTRDGSAIVKIYPAIQGEFTWRGNRTLAFRPTPRFRYSTTYSAVIAAGIRSLSGKTLPRALRWQWRTPLAYPVEVKTSTQEYFSSLQSEQKLDFAVWVEDSLILRFEQPVSAAGARDFILLREEKSGRPAAIRVSQETDRELMIRCVQELKRGLAYRFTIKEGFCGSEGRTGTDKEFTFTFDTVPSFQYSGVQPLVLYPDAPYCRLFFSNPLDALDRAIMYDPALIQIFKVSDRGGKALRFKSEMDSYHHDTIFLRIIDELASGEALKIRIDKKLANIYTETLPESLQIEARVCSSRSPHMRFALEGESIALAAKSMKKADLRMIKLKPEFFVMLQQREYGILQQKDFREKFIEKELAQKLDNLPEKANAPALGVGELGSPLGFFAFLVQRCEPYNACGDLSLLRLPAVRRQKLQVFHRRHMDMVIKAAPEQTLYWLYENRSGELLGRKPFLLRRSGETMPRGETDAQGVLVDEKGVKRDDLIIAQNPGDGDMALARIAQAPVAEREVRISIFSDRDFYQPGDTVHIAGIVKEYVSGKVSSPKASSASLEITGPDWQKVKSDRVQLDRWGGFQYAYSSDPAGKKGRYQIQVGFQDDRSWQGRHAVTIDYYQPNTFEVKVSGVAERYLAADTFRAQVNGAYLAGNPMAGDAFRYRLLLTQAHPRAFTASGLERFAFGLDRDLARDDPPLQGEKELDTEGRHVLGIPMSSFPQTNFLAGMDFSATGRSAEGKEFTARARSTYFPGDLVTGIRVGYYQNLKEKIKAELALVDPRGRTASGEVRVTLYREHYENRRRELKKVAGPDDVHVDGSKTHSFQVDQAGRYVLRCDTPDANGRVVSTSGHFFAWDSSYSDRDDHLRIESEQAVVPSGGTLKCFIRSSREGRALVTVERGRILDSRVVPLRKMTPLEIAVGKEHFPAFRLSVTALFPGNVSEETAKDYQVLDEERALQVSLECPAEIKPAGKGQLRIRVRNAQKIGEKAKLFVYAVDEGNLSLQGYQAPDPFQRFYYLNPLGRNSIRTYYSKNYTHWIFERPMMDIDLPQPAIFGRVCRPDAAPLAGAVVTLEDKDHRKLKTTTTSAQGYYRFSGLAGGHYVVKAEANGFLPFLAENVRFNGRSHRPCDLALIPASAKKIQAPAEFGEEGGVDGGVEGGVLGEALPAPMAAEAKSMARMKDGPEGGRIGGVLGGADFSGIRVRSDFREVLFFKTVETDATGKASIDFEASDQLSTYRLIAVAYNENRFGHAEKKLLVSKDLL